MLPIPDAQELRARLPRLVWGLILFGFGIALMVISRLGLSPWEVFHQGISSRTGVPLGTVGIFVGLFVLLLWLPLRERLGLGTVLNVILIGVVIDLSMLWLPELEMLAWRWVALVGGIVTIALGSGYYIGAGLGPGPRDGLMTGLAKRGLPVGLVRTGIEVTVLILGWLLGGTVGAGTVLFSFGVGPLVQLFLRKFSLAPLTTRIRLDAAEEPA
jgi:uncharacterized membrane protein YczE